MDPCAVAILKIIGLIAVATLILGAIMAIIHACEETDKEHRSPLPSKSKLAKEMEELEETKKSARKWLIKSGYKGKLSVVPGHRRKMIVEEPSPVVYPRRRRRRRGSSDIDVGGVYNQSLNTGMSVVQQAAMYEAISSSSSDNMSSSCGSSDMGSSGCDMGSSSGSSDMGSCSQ